MFQDLFYFQSYASVSQQWIQKAPTEMLHLPKPNIFIPKDLSLKEVHEKVKFGATYMFCVHISTICMNILRLQIFT
jgi:secreted Zn-dependent insulinase-like peptidase